MTRGGAVWQLVGLITRRSGVQVPPPQPFGSIAQLARAFGSYPECHRFKSYLSHVSKTLETKRFQGFYYLGFKAPERHKQHFDPYFDPFSISSF